MSQSHKRKKRSLVPINNKYSFYIENKCNVPSRQNRLSTHEYTKQTKPTEWSIFTTSNREEQPATASFHEWCRDGFPWSPPPKRDHQGERSKTQSSHLGKYHHEWGNKGVNKMHIQVSLWLLETAQLKLGDARAKNCRHELPQHCSYHLDSAAVERCLIPRD